MQGLREEVHSGAAGSREPARGLDAITLIGTMTIKPEHEAEFVDFATGIAQAVHEREPGTILYVPHEHPTEPHTYVWVERYRDPEALRAHEQASYIAEAMSRLPTGCPRHPS